MKSRYASYLFIICKVVDSSLGVRQFAVHYQMLVKILKVMIYAVGFMSCMIEVLPSFSRMIQTVCLLFHSTSPYLEWVDGQNIWG